MRRWSYLLLTLSMTVGVVLLQHTPARGADAEPLAAQEDEEGFVPTEKLPADASISFPADI